MGMKMRMSMGMRMILLWDKVKNVISRPYNIMSDNTSNIVNLLFSQIRIQMTL